MNTLRNMFLLFWLAMVPATAMSTTLEQHRSNFLLAEKLIARGHDEAFFNISAGLKDYPLYPYLQYQWLKNHLEETDRVLAFLQGFKASRYAALLRNKWLAYLAGHQRWREYIDNYHANGSVALECGFHWANYNLGHRQLALKEAKRLWSAVASQPPECEPLFTALSMSPLLTSDLIWQRFELALSNNNVSLANYLMHLLDKNDQNLAETWLQIHRKPASIQESRFWNSNQKMGRILVHGIKRLVKIDLDLALSIWDANKRTALDSRTVQTIERTLALALAKNQKPGAYQRLNQLLSSDKDIREWKVRAALFEQNWQHIADALSGLTLEELKEPIWQYWQARSLAVKGDEENARKAYLKAAEDRSFYGFMAADAVAKPYKLSDKPVFLAGKELENLAAEDEFQAVRELNYLNRKLEAELNWWYSVNKLSKERMAVAAKLAQFWGWDQLAIKTLVKADYWDDLALRFPVRYWNLVEANAARQNLDPALVLGVIRQESMLESYAHSSVGARGLMQIMPGTGKQIARNLKEGWRSDYSLFNPEINIKYGAYYYKSLLEKFKGHVALATAAYNAGPGKVRKWLPIISTVPADIWVETIPYKETRKYVTSVLYYSIIYQHRIQGRESKIKDFMRDILPG